MTKEQVRQACHRAGLPPPTFDGDIATVTIKIGPAVPKITSKQFDRWCRGVGHAGAARFINAKIGTNYALGHIYKMRRRDAPISTNIRALVRDFPGGPVDPKKEKP